MRSFTQDARRVACEIADAPDSEMSWNVGRVFCCPCPDEPAVVTSAGVCGENCQAR